jgi:hypothetical protein
MIYRQAHRQYGRLSAAQPPGGGDEASRGLPGQTWPMIEAALRPLDNVGLDGLTVRQPSTGHFFTDGQPDHGRCPHRRRPP